jgi:hypothetical protein
MKKYLYIPVLAKLSAFIGNLHEMQDFIADLQGGGHSFQ